MFKIRTLNKISPVGLDLFPRERYEVASEIGHPDAILVRSFKMHGIEIPGSVKAIARAGIGVNNIPVEACTEKGILVFNTPGANANSVKELVLTGLLISSRRVYHAVSWVRSLANNGDDIEKIMESEKSNFTGPELRGKKLGVIGLGAIGSMVANDAESLGMTVSGWDPFISVDAAWGLSRSIRKALSMDSLLSDSDYLSIHIPLKDDTRGVINASKFGIMKRGVRIMNFARGGLVNNRDLLQDIDAGIVEAYVTDFPDNDLLACDKVIPIPHLGASTPEAEDNCAVMAVEQIKDFLETGNLKNSINFPNCQMDFRKGTRIVVANKNVPNMVGQITTILANEGINISDMLNKHLGDYAYNIIDVESPVSRRLTDLLKTVTGVIMVRVIIK
ncbi:MAG: 3-phosphoglycerate dehydrogenase [Spirochaetales bacterium]|nr:MAG: 3-phosphoglycerate dehydrogenase [Spirochaetales bacterium]